MDLSACAVDRKSGSSRPERQTLPCVEDSLTSLATQLMAPIATSLRMGRDCRSLGPIVCYQRVELERIPSLAIALLYGDARHESLLTMLDNVRPF